MKTTGLTLTEAHESGRRYKRSNWSFFGERQSLGSVFWENAIATDYELEPRAKLLTEKEVARAFDDGYQRHGTTLENHKRAVLATLFGEEK